MTGSSSLRPALLLVLLVVAAAIVPSAGGADRVDASESDALANNASTMVQDDTGRFNERVVSTHRGDVLEIGVSSAKSHRVVLGGEDSGFEAAFTVTSGSATIRLNTYKAGKGSYSDDEIVWAESGSIGNVQVERGTLDRALEDGRYPMEISYNGTQADVGAFVLEERSTNHSSGWAVPKGFEVDDDTAVDDIAAAGENRTNNLSIASGDKFALEVNASGLYGIIEKSGLDGDDGIYVEFVQQNPEPNHDPNTFEGDSADHLFVDQESGRFFLLVGTQDHGIEPGDVYNATFRVTPDSGLVDEGEEETRTTRFRVLEREAEVFYRGQKLIANATGATKISGNATMVSGTEFRVRARSTGVHPFLETKVVELDDESAFETSFDVSSYPTGTNFTVFIPETGLSVPAMVGEAVTPTPTPTITFTPSPTPTISPTPSPTPTPALTYATNTPLVAQTVTESDGQPGFGLVLSAVAALAATLLARRRGRWGS